ncbi:MAG TPA: hypothetical protein VF111_13790 [Thermoanaerobaculia bacterium]
MFRLLPLLLAAPLAFAEPLPSFDARSLSWDATDVVVATEGETVDGTVEVVEVWKGELRPGAVVRVEGLAAEQNRAIDRAWYQQPDERRPKVVTGRRMLLFLVRNGEAFAPAAEIGERMKISTIWFEEGRSFGYGQDMVPGPLLLIEQTETEGDFARDVAKHVEAQNELDRLIAEPARLIREGKVDHRTLRRLKQFGRRGETALLAILDEPSLGRWHRDAVHALASSDEKTLLPLLDREIAFWRNPVDGGIGRLGRTHAVLTMLAPFRALAEARAPIATLQELTRAAGQTILSAHCRRLLERE